MVKRTMLVKARDWLAMRGARLRCWALHRRYHSWRPVYHSWWRSCSKCDLSVLIED